jgi:short subunit dehydrogenase-like uncharacterized protein
MITLFGATGYTGTLVAKALDQAEMPFRIAGRSQDRLQRLSSGLKCKPECLVVDIGYTQSLMDLTRNTKLLINCTGPFTDYGERVARQAAVSGVHYLDTTNELGYVYKLQSYDRLAAKSQAALVPSCAFEVALADCAATFLAESFSPPYDEVRVIYHLPGQFSSRGTRKSALRSLATSWVAYRNGHWVGEAPCSRSIKQSISGQVHTLLSMPSCESVIIPPGCRSPPRLDFSAQYLFLSMPGFSAVLPAYGFNNLCALVPRFLVLHSLFKYRSASTRMTKSIPV